MKTQRWAEWTSPTAFSGRARPTSSFLSSHEWYWHRRDDTFSVRSSQPSLKLSTWVVAAPSDSPFSSLRLCSFPFSFPLYPSLAAGNNTIVSADFFLHPPLFSLGGRGANVISPRADSHLVSFPSCTFLSSICFAKRLFYVTINSARISLLDMIRQNYYRFDIVLSSDFLSWPRLNELQLAIRQISPIILCNRIPPLELRFRVVSSYRPIVTFLRFEAEIETRRGVYSMRLASARKCNSKRGVLASH